MGRPGKVTIPTFPVVIGLERLSLLSITYRGQHTRAPTGLIMESTNIRSKLDLKNKPQ